MSRREGTMGLPVVVPDWAETWSCLDLYCTLICSSGCLLWLYNR